jgi:hypothetical protein
VALGSRNAKNVVVVLRVAADIRVPTRLHMSADYAATQGRRG